jgi:hypothetical protein
LLSQYLDCYAPATAAKIRFGDVVFDKSQDGETLPIWLDRSRPLAVLSRP